ncbi:hypothetical protein PJN91_17260 [Mycobacterium kansasii]
MSEHRPHTLLLIEDQAGRWYWELEAANGTRVAQSMNAVSSGVAARRGLLDGGPEVFKFTHRRTTFGFRSL